MTATAAEDVGGYRAFENQKHLLAATAQTFGDFEMKFVAKQDHAGRPYIEAQVSPDEEQLVHVATTTLERMVFEDVEVLALREMKSIYEEFANDDSGDDIYLGDGMSMRVEGKMVEK